MTIVEFIAQKAYVASDLSHYLSGLDWRVQLKNGLNSLKDEDVENLRSHPDLRWYLDRGAIVFRDEPETPFQRTLELEELYKSQGYSAIASLAIKFGISKPASGWKDAIPLIVQAEAE